MGKIRDIFKRLFEHILFWIITSVISTLGFGWLIKDILLKYLAIEIPIWTSILFVFAVLIIIALYIELKNKSRKTSFITSFRWRSGDEIEIPFEFNHIGWIAYIPPQHFRRDEYVWLTGPFCPNCKMELKFKKGAKWYCQNCNQYYKASQKKEADCKNFVKDMVYAQAFRERKFKEIFGKKD